MRFMHKIPTNMLRPLSDPNYINKQQIRIGIYAIYAQNSHEHVSAGIPAILRVMF